MKPRSLGASVLALAASVLAGAPKRPRYDAPIRFSTFRPNPLSASPPYNQRKARKARRARHAHGDRKAFL